MVNEIESPYYEGGKVDRKVEKRIEKMEVTGAVVDNRKING